MFELQKNLSNTEISHIRYEGDKLHVDMVDIPEFLPKKNFSFYIVGRPKSGKSTLLHHLLCSDGRKIKNKNLHKPKFYYKQFDKVIIFSPSIKTSSKPFPLPKKNIYDEYEPELLQEVIEEIQDEGQNQNVCMVFDDVIKSLQKGGENAGRVLHKLLLNRREINRLQKKIDELGMTLVPKDLYINGQGKVKLTICLSKGKRQYDKREVLQEKTMKRESERTMKNLRM
jgi:hypothetical protein